MVHRKIIQTTHQSVLDQLVDLSRSGTQLVVFHSVKDIPREAWAYAAPKDNMFLQLDYLSTVEMNPPVEMKFAYLLFYQDKIPLGVAICQIQNFKADNSLNLEDKKSSPCFFSTFARFIRGMVTSKVEFNVLVVGNLLLTGEHGHYLDPERIGRKEGFALLEEALKKTSEVLDRRGDSSSCVLQKDFYEESRADASSLTDSTYNEFTIQPNMVLRIRPEWKTFDDYLGAMYSKYRVRVKRARKKGEPIEKRAFEVNDIIGHLDELYELYRQIASNSGFNMINLNKTYLLGLKEQFPERFSLVGYFIDNKLVGFFTTIHNGKELEAHFLGLERDTNQKYQIYLNMLYDMVQVGIDKGVEKIVFARTATAIKSSIGAEANEMYCYLRHRNPFTNKFVNPVLEYLRPKEEWEPRHPFKEK